jgi:hypothetical protein
MSEVIPCEGHSQNTKQSPSLGVTVATLPLLPIGKLNCPESGMTIFIEKERRELEIKFFTMINR